MRLLEWFVSMGGTVNYISDRNIRLSIKGYMFEYIIHKSSLDESIEEAIQYCVAGKLGALDA